MTQNPYHTPVMANEVVELLRPVSPRLLVDATYGGGGHTSALLEAFPGLSVVAIDQDPDAIAQGPVGDGVRLVKANFGSLDQIAAEICSEGIADGTSIPPCFDAFLFDIGVSSHQLDESERGFSYRRRGPVDMRMDRDAELGADTIVNQWPVDDIADVLWRYGEERLARRIARAIVAARPITDTAHLASVVAESVPAAVRRRKHPARKVFQAIRIAVNDELGSLELGLEAAISWVRPGGRVLVISYHSLEDRMVKRRFAAGSAGCECPPDFPVCTCGRVAELWSPVRKPLRPTEQELALNPRARSAILRVAEKVSS
ncbi:MAG: 16S rRNA (cytosine(1402)-N(4))-methyltransferase RsmH [Actinomycetota bacterium]|nr:16S rRNA (cytosine(1402)-N(4))-methyltransferase RsmH [Actinomycetota bacterium]